MLVFLLGYIPSCSDARFARRQQSSLEYRLKFAELNNKLGMMSYEANRNNYASAMQFSTEFFDGLQSISNEVEDRAMRDKLKVFLSKRDEITTNLAQADPVVKDKLAAMFAEMCQMTDSLKDSRQNQ